jgi:hypothetical protein
MEQVTPAEAYDMRASFPDHAPADMTDFSLIFDRRHDGLMTCRTITFLATYSKSAGSVRTSTG